MASKVPSCEKSQFSWIDLGRRCCEGQPCGTTRAPNIKWTAAPHLNASDTGFIVDADVRGPRRAVRSQLAGDVLHRSMMAIIRCYPTDHRRYDQSLESETTGTIREVVAPVQIRF